MSEYLSALQKAVRDPDTQVQTAARLALSRLDRVAVARASTAILSGDDRLQKLQLIAALVDGGGEQAVARLGKVLAEDPDEDCRAAAARGLGELGKAEAEVALVAAAADPSLPVRMEATRALGTVGAEAAVGALVGLLDDELMVAVEAAASLGRLEASEALPDLARCLRGPAPELRSAAAAALGQLRDTRAAAELAFALGDAERDVRLAAARALAQVPLPEGEAAGGATTPPPR